MRLISPCLILCLAHVAFAHEPEPREQTVTPFRRVRIDRALNDSLARAQNELLAEIPALVFAVEENFPEALVRARALAVARLIAYYGNALPATPQTYTEWEKTKQIQRAARMIKTAFDQRLSASPAPKRTRASIKALLSETMVRAQVENHILARMIGNDLDLRRTNRVLREVARRLPLTCEYDLYKAPLI